SCSNNKLKRGDDSKKSHHALGLWDEEKRRQGWEDKADLGQQTVLERLNPTVVSDVGAAITRGIGVEHLAPMAEERHPDPIVPVDLRREVDDDETARAAVPALAQPGKNTPIAVIGDQPLETGAVAIELMQGGQVAVEVIEVADQRVDA